MDKPQIFETIEEIRKRALISDRFYDPLKEALEMATPATIEYLLNENSNTRRTSTGQSVVVMEDDTQAKGADGRKLVLYRCVSAGIPIPVLRLPPLNEYCLVIEAKGTHRHIVIARQLVRTSPTTFDTTKLQNKFFLDEKFNSTACEDPVWRDLIDRIRRVQRKLVHRFAGS